MRVRTSLSKLNLQFLLPFLTRTRLLLCSIDVNRAMSEVEAVSKDVYNAACRCQLRPAVKAVLQQLAWFANENGENSFPKVLTIAGRTSLTRRGVQKVLRELESQGIITGSGSRLGGSGHSTHYRINLGCLFELSQSANGVRPSHQKKGESHDTQRANIMPENGEQPSPEQNNNEKEKATPYEVQALQARIRKTAKGMGMHTMTYQEEKERRAYLQGQKVALLSLEAHQQQTRAFEGNDD